MQRASVHRLWAYGRLHTTPGRAWFLQARPVDVVHCRKNRCMLSESLNSWPAQDVPLVSAAFNYPEHLRASLVGMPAAPGVYTFHAGEARLPLYIGKSVNLRARILSHLRNADEARMLRQATHISFIRTAGDIGAQLLEAQMIKQQLPLFNQKLRRNRQLCSLQLRDGVPEVVFSKALDFAQTPGLFGLFSSRHAALEALRGMADRLGLCYGRLGLERLAPGRPCFRHMVKLCAGVCCGKESAVQHDARLHAALQALRVTVWPYPGAVALQERCADMRQLHVLHNWCYLGSAPDVRAARKLGTVAAGFDADGYRILCAPMLSGQHRIVPL